MNVQSQIRQASPGATEHFDVLIAGAGISGVGAAYHLTTQCPDMTFVALDMQETFGGTWWHASLSRHPLRQRSPHLRLPLQAVDRPADRDRRRDPRLHGRGDRGERSRPPHPLSSTRSSRRSWSSADNLWTIEATRTDTGETLRFHRELSAGCARATTATPQGYTADMAGYGRLQGPDRALRRHGRRTSTSRTSSVVVIGSGATAATHHPGDRRRTALTSRCCSARRRFSVTGRNAIELAETLRQLQVDETWIHEIVAPQDPVRSGYVHPPLHRGAGRRQEGFAHRRRSQACLGPDYDVETHFTPTYRPWRQRIAFMPDARPVQEHQRPARPRW